MSKQQIVKERKRERKRANTFWAIVSVNTTSEEKTINASNVLSSILERPDFQMKTQFILIS